MKVLSGLIGKDATAASRGWRDHVLRRERLLKEKAVGASKARPRSHNSGKNKKQPCWKFCVRRDSVTKLERYRFDSRTLESRLRSDISQLSVGELRKCILPAAELRDMPIVHMFAPRDVRCSGGSISQYEQRPAPRNGARSFNLRSAFEFKIRFLFRDPAFRFEIRFSIPDLSVRRRKMHSPS
jgi:hypothetical protein